MAQLLVRDIEDWLVQKLKRRARVHGVSAEEEHRRILKETLAKPLSRKPTFIEFLLSPENEVAPDVDLELNRSREIEPRDTGL